MIRKTHRYVMPNMWRFVITMISAMASSTVVMMVNADCDETPCQNGGVCQAGSHPGFGEHPASWDGTPFEFHKINGTASGYHCKCPTNFTGLSCEKEMQVCSEAKDTSGNTVYEHVCYNGGKCLDGLPESSYLICDCTQTNDESTGKRYVGKYCEDSMPIPQSGSNMVTCTTSGVSGENGCLNGGICQNGPDGKTKCVCKEEFKGPNCEYHESTVVSACDLDCKNGGLCEIGIRGPNSAAEGSDILLNMEQDDLNINMQHCVCPTGYVGALCQIQAIPCGTLSMYNYATVSQLFCMHGSTCIHSVNANDEKENHCDCNTAHTDTTSYAGIGCQFEADAYCSKVATLSGHKICVNGGTCVKQEQEDMMIKAHCDCPEGFHGESCEFANSLNFTEEYHGRNCSLECANGGKCKKGLKDYGLLNALRDRNATIKGPGSLDHIMEQMPNASSWDEALKGVTGYAVVEHCACPAGFTGIYCQHKADVCSDHGHVCFYGSKCLGTDGDYSCDCDAADELLAGYFCQYRATSKCDGNSGVKFCVNNGKCPTNDGGECECFAGFSGPQCANEIRNHNKNKDGDTGSGDTGSGDTGSGDTGSGNTGSGNTGSGNTGSGNTGSGDTGSGDTGSGHTGSAGNSKTYRHDDRKVLISLLSVVAIGLMLILAMICLTHRGRQIEMATDPPKTSAAEAMTLSEAAADSKAPPPAAFSGSASNGIDMGADADPPSEKTDAELL